MRTFAITTIVHVHDERVGLGSIVAPDTDELLADAAANLVADEIVDGLRPLSELSEFIVLERGEVKEVI